LVDYFDRLTTRLCQHSVIRDIDCDGFVPIDFKAVSAAFVHEDVHVDLQLGDITAEQKCVVCVQ